MLNLTCLIVLVLFSCYVSGFTPDKAQSTFRPPHFNSAPETRYIPKGSNFWIHCSPSTSNGINGSSITWWRNDQRVFKSVHHDILQNGTLVGKKMRADLTGQYQCKVKSNWGTALSNVTTVRIPVLQSLRTLTTNSEPYRLPVSLEEGVLLSCDDWRTEPTSSVAVTWCRQRDNRSPCRPIPKEDQNGRVIVPKSNSAHKGLLITQVKEQDLKYIYKCKVVHSILMEALENYTQLVSKGSSSQPRAIQCLGGYPANEKVIAIEGTRTVLACFFGGASHIKVEWEHHNREQDGPVIHPDIRYDGNELIIPSVTGSHAGTYSCTGIANGLSRSINKKFTLQVESKPEFITKPNDVEVTTGQSTTLACDVRGTPEPTITWSVNGKTITPKSDGSLWVEEGNKLTLKKASESLIVQCKASQTHGEIWANIFLNVTASLRLMRKGENENLVPIDAHTQLDVLPGDNVTLLCKAPWRNDTGLEWKQGHSAMGPPRTVTKTSHILLQGGKEFGKWHYTCFATSGKLKLNKTVTVNFLGGANAAIANDHREDAKSSGVKTSGATTPSTWYMGWIVGIIGVVLLVTLGTTVVIRQCRKRAKTDDASKPMLGRAPSQMRPCEDSFRLSVISDECLRMTIQEFLIKREQLVVGKLLGKGHFGRVYAAFHKNSSGALVEVAVKTLKYKPDETEMIERFLREAVMMKDFRHKHVLSLIGVCFTADESPMVVLPFMANGDLRKYIREPHRIITVMELLNLGLQVAEGMKYLASMRFVHRDLAARNCMVDETLCVKVADFGLSRDLYSRDYYRLGQGDSLLPVRWMAIESLQDSVFTSMSDVWSFGVLLWELMTRGAVPYPDVDNWDIRNYLLSGRRLSQPTYCPDSVFNIMARCWSRVPLDRPKFDELCYLLKEVLESNGPGNATDRDKRRLSISVVHDVIPPEDPQHASGATTV